MNFTSNSGTLLDKVLLGLIEQAIKEKLTPPPSMDLTNVYKMINSPSKVKGN